MHDKNGIEIKAGDTLFNPHDRDMYHTVLQDGDEVLYLGDFDSPLKRYGPETWWEIVEQEVIPGTRAALASLWHNGEVRGASVTAPPACEASSAEGATSTVVLEGSTTGGND